MSETSIVDLQPNILEKREIQYREKFLEVTSTALLVYLFVIQKNKARPDQKILKNF